MSTVFTISDRLEEYLGERMNKIRYSFSLNYDADQFSSSLDSIYLPTEFNEVLFLDRRCFSVHFESADIQTINEVSVVIPKIDIVTYNQFVSFYGTPDKMFRGGKVIRASEYSNEQYSAKSVVKETIDCSFEEDPMFITWEKNDFQIKIQMDEQHGVSLISFRIKQ